MPQNIGADEGFFNTQIPRIDENADIQTALRLYHYGEGNFNGSKPLNSNSISGYLDALEEGKVDKLPGSIPLNADLDDYTESGFYIQASDVRARSGANYPLAPPNVGFAYAGLLRVVSDKVDDDVNNIFQEYQIGSIENGQTYWRAKFGAKDWNPWQTYAVDGHVHDERYYRKQESDDRYLPAIKYLTIRQPSITENQYTLSILDESALVMIDNLSFPSQVYIPSTASVPFIVGTQITVLQKNLGQTTILGDPGVTVNATPGNRLRARWSSASLIKIGAEEWVVVGDLTG